jgi:hypothetical protein
MMKISPIAPSHASLKATGGRFITPAIGHGGAVSAKRCKNVDKHLPLAKMVPEFANSKSD